MAPGRTRAPDGGSEAMTPQYRLPNGYAVVQVVPASGTSMRVRRIIVLAGLAFLAWSIFFAGEVSADTVPGRSTNGCVNEAVLWSGELTGIESITLGAKAVLNAHPTVLWVGFAYEGAVESEYWWYSNGTASTTILIGLPQPNGARIGIKAGTTGTGRFIMRVPGYAPASCATITDVRVVRTFHSATATQAPGGGGVAPTPTPAGPTPTPPTMPTPVPGGTPEDGYTCFDPDLTGPDPMQCYPEPPAGWCYLPVNPATDPDGVLLIQCAPAPSAPPAGANTHTFSCTTTGATCVDWTDSNGQYVYNTAGDRWLFDFGTDRNMSGSPSYDNRLYVGINAGLGEAVGFWAGVTPTGKCANAQWLDYVIANGAGSDHCSVTTTNGSDGGAGNCGGVSGCIWFQGAHSGGDTVTYTVTITLLEAGSGSPNQTPSAPPVTDPTIPPDWWGPGRSGPPDVNLDIDVNVDICEDDPDILACQYSFPPMDIDICADNPTIAACATPQPAKTPGPGGELPTGSAVPNGLEECLLESHPPKPGTMPLDTIATVPPGGTIFDEIGTHVGNIPRVAGNTVKTGVNTGIDYVVPGECVEDMVGAFADDVAGTPPFSYFFEARSAFDTAATGEGTVEFTTVNIAGAELDLSDVFLSVGGMLAPYGGVLQLIPYGIIAIVIMKKVAGTVGAGEGGG